MSFVVLDLVYNPQTSYFDICFVYNFFISKYLYKLFIYIILHFGYTLVYIICFLFSLFEVSIFLFVFGILFL